MIKSLLLAFLFTAPVYGESLSICVTKEDLSPASSLIETKVYEPLVKYDEKKKKYFGNILEKIELINHKKLKLTIKSGISFHSNHFYKPKRKLNIEDVIFTFMRLKTSTDEPFYKNIKELIKIDNKTLLIESNISFKNIYKNLSLQMASIQSKEYSLFLKMKNELSLFSSFPIGTAQYKLLKKTHNSITLNKFTNYWNKETSIKLMKIVFRKSSNKYQCDIYKKGLR
jgi:ABC-type transport system substrate-binding protein